MKKQAFTLAEVLITLTIIGVIAAITIPNLMQSWRRHERISQIKQAYSILNHAFKMAVSENGGYEDMNWDFATSSYSSSAFAEKIIPFLKVKEDCKTGNSKCSAFENRAYYYMNGTKVGDWTTPYTIKLENGMDISIRTSPNGPKVYIVVDVNGRKGPTKAGVDVFGFQANLQSGTGYISTNTSNDSKFNNYREVMTTGLNQCNTTSNQAGLNCTHLLELNHWEFPDDYPVKIK